SEMHAPASRRLLDLLAAGEPIRDEQGVVAHLPHRGKELVLADGHRDVVLVALEAERSRHPAAARVHYFRVDAEALEHLFLLRESEDRLVVAISVDLRAGAQRGNRARIALREKLGERARLRGEPLGVL